MSFAEEFKTDREKVKKEFFSYSGDIVTAQEAILDEIVFKEFDKLHKSVSTATHFRVTFHSDIKEKITYNTRLNGEYSLKDPVVDGVTKDLLSLAVMLVEDSKDDLMEGWADGMSAREEYDTENERCVYTFEFFGDSQKKRVS